MIIQASNITKRYGNLEVLKGVDLEIERGGISAIVGASGAGKTTLLQILGTLDKPDEGSLTINNTNVLSISGKKLAAFRNEQVGFVFQFHQLLPEFSALENAMLPALIHGQSKKNASAKAAGLLERLGIADRAKHKPSELSGGEQQRVAICRALINNPAVVFADEPTGNLDSKNARSLHELFGELCKEMDQTFIIVTHNEELASIADRTLTMEDGRIL